MAPGATSRRRSTRSRRTDPVELDFNYAYNPSCVYSPAYDCPYPPRQNQLSLPVRAGERLPYDEAH